MTEADRLRLLACQAAVPQTTSRAERDAHLAALSAKVRDRCSGEPVDLVVPPELVSIDHSRAAFDRLNDLAEPLDGPSFEHRRQVARVCHVHIAYSFPRRASDGYRISSTTVRPSGDLEGSYDKIHLAQYGASMEKEYNEGGDELFLFEVKGFKAAPIICCDIRIPELCRALTVDHGVDLILHPSAYYRDEFFYSWHAFAISRAIENQVYFLSLNRAGENFGGSIFCSPWMDETCEPVRFSDQDEQFLSLAVERRQISDARKRYSFLVDRRDHYGLPLNRAGNRERQAGG
ncbi:MAG: carbon-nitrogen hydrolase family protein [Hyphomicrobiales bacterium]|nr:carbon-nitrogen hydrolase family protein [Hyphomicrobiales bacterium]